MEFVQPIAPISHCGTRTATSAICIRSNGVDGDVCERLFGSGVPPVLTMTASRIDVSARCLRKGTLGGTQGDLVSMGDSLMSKLSGRSSRI